jgi:hypothetical protein
VIDPAKTCLFIPAGLKSFKLKLFERIGSKLGRVIRGDVSRIGRAASRHHADRRLFAGAARDHSQWRIAGRPFVYWDQGLCKAGVCNMAPTRRGRRLLSLARRVVSASENPRRARRSLGRAAGRDKTLAKGRPPHRDRGADRTYSKFHGTRDWIADTIDALARVTDRQLVIRDKESKRSLQPISRAPIAWSRTGRLRRWKASFSAVRSLFIRTPPPPLWEGRIYLWSKSLRIRIVSGGCWSLACAR